jgi:hypothetical protein
MCKLTATHNQLHHASLDQKNDQLAHHRFSQPFPVLLFHSEPIGLYDPVCKNVCLVSEVFMS